MLTLMLLLMSADTYFNAPSAGWQQRSHGRGVAVGIGLPLKLASGRAPQRQARLQVLLLLLLLLNDSCPVSQPEEHVWHACMTDGPAAFRHLQGLSSSPQQASRSCISYCCCDGTLVSSFPMATPEQGIAAAGLEVALAGNQIMRPQKSAA